MEQDHHLQVGFFRAAKATLLRYWVDYGYGDEYDSAYEMLCERARKIPDDDYRQDTFVFDDPNQELFFKLRFSDSFMEDEQTPWSNLSDDDYFYSEDEWYYTPDWQCDPEPVHDRFFVPFKVKTHYGLGWD